MRWRRSLMGLLFFWSGPSSLTAMADVQPGQYRLTVTHGTSEPLKSGPLSGVLPQLSGTQQWLLLAIGFAGLILLTFLTIIWWRNRQSIKEQPK